ncbi:MAG TPA: hypothetical protein VLU43_08635 [Anaeromyxobacteraceae bacterium]|nr:hypothetical protein [Anaeromyxobacteraceae bacterium]
MSEPAIVTKLLGRLQKAIPAWQGWARRAWCQEQRRRLTGAGRSVVWVRGDKEPWAQWGARHGFFDVERMDGLPYLRALGAPVV